MHYVLYRLEENSGFFGVFVVIGTALAVDVRYLLIVTTFAYTYFTYAVEQIIEVISPEYIFPFQAFVIQYETFGEEFMWKCFTTSQVTEIQRQTDTPQN